MGPGSVIKRLQLQHQLKKKSIFSPQENKELPSLHCMSKWTESVLSPFNKKGVSCRIESQTFAIYLLQNLNQSREEWNFISNGQNISRKNF
jgi:hypothetical protein